MHPGIVLGKHVRKYLVAFVDVHRVGQLLDYWHILDPNKWIAHSTNAAIFQPEDAAQCNHVIVVSFRRRPRITTDL
ncbi:MAG: hypothetical protein WC100_13390 [Sterolibacterium sp.]